MSSGVFLGLGSNLGDRLTNLSQAVIMLSRLNRLLIERESSVYQTKPYGITQQPEFFNMVIEVDTSYSPVDLLHEIMKIEDKLKRLREQKWGPRVIDIDILFYRQAVIHEQELSVPHYDMHNRDFCLYPMLELAPNFMHPGFKRTIAELAAELMVK
ncbi:MAG: 2-amino-4-hydroxy-6-hydroxymethyldihydropteridine diphosphokinase [Candidatus Wallbacteria bacterium]|nr:2-amino-4-hydroxy-6-hydroxymethyldihydropteridine diphosphokinase [Candidatus Wallbacteria bacterium]